MDWALIEHLKSGDGPPQRRYCTARRAVYQPPHLVLFMDRYPDGAGLAMDRLHVVHHRADTDDIFDMFPPERFPGVASLIDPVAATYWSGLPSARDLAPESAWFHRSPDRIYAWPPEEWSARSPHHA